MREVVEEVAFQARGDRKIDKRSGVSQRLPITHARARRLERRAARARERRDARRAARHRRLRGAAVDHRQVRARIRRRAARRRAGRARSDPRRRSATVFTGMFDGVDTRTVIEWFDLGGSLPLSDSSSADEVIAPDARRPGPARAGRRTPACAPGAAGAGRRLGDRLRARRALRAEEDQPQRRARLLRRGSRAAPRRGARREEPALDEEIRMPARQEEVLQLAARAWELGAMKYRYTKFTGDPLDELDLEDLVSKLSDLLLSSGFGNPHGHDEDERTMQALHDAILDALFNGGVLPEETHRAAARRSGRRRSGRRALEARGADPADHRADERAGLHHRRRPISRPSASGARAAAAARGRISRR